MSYEQSIYTRDVAATHAELISALSAKGWKVAFVPSGHPERAGALSSGEFYGWQGDELSREAVGAILDAGNDGEVQRRLKGGVLATCELFVKNRYSVADVWTNAELDELVDEVGEEYVSHLREARARLTTRTNAACGPLSGQFQSALTDALVALTHGFLTED